MQLLSDSRSNPFRSTLFAFGQIQIILSGILAMHSRFIEVVFVAHLNYDLFKVLSSFIQKIDVLRECDVLWRTRGIKYYGSLISLLIVGLAIIVLAIASGRIIRTVVFCDHLVDLVEYLRSESFAKLNQKRWYKRLFVLITRQPYKKLIVRVFTDLFHEFTIGIIVLLLDDQCPPSLQWFSRHSSITRKQPGVTIFNLTSGYCCRSYHPPIVRIHFQSDGLIKIRQAILMISIEFVHWVFSEVQGFL